MYANEESFIKNKEYTKLSWKLMRRGNYKSFSVYKEETTKTYIWFHVLGYTWIKFVMYTASNRPQE